MLRTLRMHHFIPARFAIQFLLLFRSLIEMSTLMGWPHPKVEDEQRTGPAHDPRFTVSCYFSKFKTFATSRSKKEAKRLAAFDMHENMRYQPDIMYKYSIRTGRPMVRLLYFFTLTNQRINQSTNQSVNQSIKEPSIRSTKHSGNQSIKLTQSKNRTN